MQLPDDLLPTLAQYAPRAAAALIRATAKSWAANAGEVKLWNQLVYLTLRTNPARLPELQKAVTRTDIRPEDVYSPGSKDAALFTFPSLARYIPAPIQVTASQVVALNDGRFVMVRGNRLSLYTSMGQEIWADIADGESYENFIVSEEQTWLAVHTRTDAEVLRIGATMTATGLEFSGGGDNPTLTFCGETQTVLRVVNPAGTRFTVYTIATGEETATWQDPRQAMVVVGAKGGVAVRYTETHIVLYNLDGQPVHNFSDRGKLFIATGMALGPRFYIWQYDPKKLLEVDASNAAVTRELKGPIPNVSGMRIVKHRGVLCALVTLENEPRTILCNLENNGARQTFFAPHDPESVSVANGHIYYVDYITDRLVRYKLM